MITLKIYSKQKPVGLQTNILETYLIENGKKTNSMWYSEISTDDYIAEKLKLEDLGYLAHPASSQEITTQEYSIFHMGGN